MSPSIGRTLADESDAELVEASPKTASALLLLLEGERPEASSALHVLSSVATVVLGRGLTRACSRPAQHHHADLEIQVPDLRMSGRHAVLTQVRGRWLLEDSNSRNGTKVNGDPVEHYQLENHDLIELGRTVFVFLQSIEPLGAADVDTDPARLSEAEKPMTLVPALARELVKLKKLASETSVSLLLSGESGTGKEVLARQIASWSGRRGRFVGVNCGAIAETLLESELFGSTRGAFSGATQERLGLVRSADEGTLFLDEIADLPHTSQAALLRVLQEREVLAVGASTPSPVNIRLISATHQDLNRAVEQGAFRQDLFARVAGFQTRLPPLRERRIDLGLLIAALIPKLTEKRLSFAPEAIRAMFNYAWPLNIRELQNCLSTAIALSGGAPVQVSHLPPAVQDGRAGNWRLAHAPPSRPLSEQQQQHRTELEALLDRHHGNVSAVARELGKARAQVQRWLKRYELNSEEYKRR